MSIEVRFTEIEDELMGVVDDCISKVLKGKKYHKDDAKDLCEELSNELNEALQSKKKGI